MATDSLNTFGIPIIPANEPERLNAIARYRANDLPPGAFNHIAQMAVRMFKVPIALINIVGSDEVLTVAASGEVPVGTRVPRGVSLCSLAVLDANPTVFGNALEEPCLLANPNVTGELGLRFYAAAPLITPDGYEIGAVCLVDKEARDFDDGEQKVLSGLAQIVMDDIVGRLDGKGSLVAKPAR